MGLFFSLFGEMYGGREVIYNLFPKFQMRHVGLSFYGPRKSDEGGDTDLTYNFCWPKFKHNKTLL